MVDDHRNIHSKPTATPGLGSEQLASMKPQLTAADQMRFTKNKNNL